MRYSLVKTYQVTINPCLHWYLHRLWEHMDVRWGKTAHVPGGLPKSAVQILSSQDPSPFAAVVSVSVSRRLIGRKYSHNRDNINAKLPCIHTMRFGPCSESRTQMHFLWSCLISCFSFDVDTDYCKVQVSTWNSCSLVYFWYFHSGVCTTVQIWFLLGLHVP